MRLHQRLAVAFGELEELGVAGLVALLTLRERVAGDVLAVAGALTLGVRLGLGLVVGLLTLPFTLALLPAAACGAALDNACAACWSGLAAGFGRFPFLPDAMLPACVADSPKFSAACCVAAASLSTASASARLRSPSCCLASSDRFSRVGAPSSEATCEPCCEG